MIVNPLERNTWRSGVRSAMHTWRGPTYVDDALVMHTPGRRQLKTPILSRNVDQKSLETEFSIAATLATNGNQNHCFYRFLIRVRRLLIAFAIATYWLWCSFIKNLM